MKREHEKTNNNNNNSASTRSWQRMLWSRIVSNSDNSRNFRSLSFKYRKFGALVPGVLRSPNISISISVRAVRLALCLCVYQVKRFSFIKSNPFRLVLIFQTQRTKRQTNKQTTTNSSQIFIPSFIANETLLNLVEPLPLAIQQETKKFESIVWKRPGDRNPPNSIRSFSAKDYLSGFWLLIAAIFRTKKNFFLRLTKKEKERREENAANKQHTTTNENEKRVFVFRLDFLN